MQAAENKFHRRIQEYGKAKLDSQMNTLTSSLNAATSMREVEVFGGVASATIQPSAIGQRSDIRTGPNQIAGYVGKHRRLHSLLPGESRNNRKNALMAEYKYGQSRLRRHGTGFNNQSSIGSRCGRDDDAPAQAGLNVPEGGPRP